MLTTKGVILKSLLLIILLLASSSVFAMGIHQYDCVDAENHWKISAHISDRRSEIGSFVAYYEGWKVIDTNINHSNILILGMSYDMQPDVEFTVQQSGEIYFIAKNQPIELKCEVKHFEEEPKLCERKSCTRDGVSTMHYEVPQGYHCAYANVMCK